MDIEENPFAVAEYAGSNEPTTATEAQRQLTPQERRNIEVSEALLPAYQKAGTLELTDEEIEKLTARFPDEVIEIRPHDGLIYLPHIFIRQRLNQVFKPGQWAIIRRREWIDEATHIVYGEYVLIVRGCLIGESVGGHPYVPTNPKTNYSDALESTEAEALRRICGKRLSCGEQCWEPEYARQWVAKYAYQQGGKWFKRFNQTQQPTQPKSQPKPEPKASNPEKCKARMLNVLRESFGEELATEYAVKANILLPTETLDDWPLTKVPVTADDFHKLEKDLQAFQNGEPVGENEEWRKFPVPFGQHKDQPLGELNTKTIFGYWANFKVEEEYNGKPKKPETIERDKAFRQALDEAGKHYGFEKRD